MLDDETASGLLRPRTRSMFWSADASSGSAFQGTSSSSSSSSSIWNKASTAVSRAYKRGCVSCKRYHHRFRRLKNRWLRKVPERLRKLCLCTVPEEDEEDGAGGAGDGKRRIVTLSDPDANEDFRNNFVATSKYTLWSFLPVFLMQQLMRPANMYFLIAGTLSSINLFALATGFGKFGLLLTLSIMILISGVRESIEDTKRHKQDRRVNNAETEVVGMTEKQKWGTLCVGQIVKLRNREHVPADMLLLCTSSLDGVVFVETKNLDGESNLKRKISLSGLSDYCGDEKQLLSLKGFVECDAPNDKIYEFKGVLTIEVDEMNKASFANTQSFNSQPATQVTALPAEISEIEAMSSFQPLPNDKQFKKFPLSPECFLVRGSSIQNTETVYGLVIYAGLDTKLLKNMKDPPKKVSQVEKKANWFLVGPVILQMFCTILFAILGILRCSDVLWYIKQEGECTTLDQFALVVRYWIVFIGFVPIGLYVTMEIVRVLQLVFIQGDQKMYYAPLDVRTQVRTTGLNEELGIVDYVFSDKTGTLTANEMVFKKCWINGVVYTKSVETDTLVYDRVESLTDLSSIMQQIRLQQGEITWVKKGSFVGRIPSLSKKDSSDIASSLVKKQPSRDQERNMQKKSSHPRDGGENFGPNTKSSSVSSYKDVNVKRISVEDAEMGLQFFHMLSLCHTVIPERSVKVEQKKELTRRKLTMNEEEFERQFGLQLQDLVGGHLPDADGAETKASRSPPEPKSETSSAIGTAERTLPASETDRNSAGSEITMTTENTIITGLDDDKDDLHDVRGTPKYQATSPDEAALVVAAFESGFEFVSRTSSTMTLQTFGIKEEWEVLAVIEFTSARKRMSIVVRPKVAKPKGPRASSQQQQQQQQAIVDGEKKENKIRLYCKGADSIIFSRLAPGQEQLVEEMREDLDSFAADGLRTLVMGYAELDEDFFLDWLRSYTEASGILGNEREAAMANCENELERDLILLGATAIEDRLQDGVPEALQSLYKAGIKLWVCTGDKQETAINIALSCGILEAHMDVAIINEHNLEDAEAQIDKTIGRWTALKQMRGAEIGRIPVIANNPSQNSEGQQQVQQQQKHGLRRFGKRFVNFMRKLWILMFGTGPDPAVGDAFPKSQEKLDYTIDTDIASFGIVIDGPTLVFALDPSLEKKFMILGRLAKTVITCRVSPKQKSQIVELVRKFEKDKVTLAIGDGANDVGMIYAAHVGIGLYGKEGVEAVLASDFALGQFRFLERLLIVHGRWSYKRMCKLVMAVIYKSIVWTMLEFWSGFYQNFSSQPITDPLLGGLYNLICTVIPTLILGVWDYDVDQEYALMFPEIYRKCQRRTSSRYRVFLSWMFAAFWQSLIVFQGVRYGYGRPYSLSDMYGREAGLSARGMIYMGATVIGVHAYLGLFIGAWNCFTGSLYLLSLSIYLFSAIIFCTPAVGNALSAEYVMVAQTIWSQGKVWLVWFILAIMFAMPYGAYKYWIRAEKPGLKQLIQELMRGGLTRDDVVRSKVEVPSQLGARVKSRLPTFVRHEEKVQFSGYNFETDDTGALLRSAFRPDYRGIQMRYLKRSGSDTELDVRGVRSEKMAEYKHRRAVSDAAGLLRAHKDLHAAGVSNVPFDTSNLAPSQETGGFTELRTQRKRRAPKKVKFGDHPDDAGAALDSSKDVDSPESPEQSESDHLHAHDDLDPALSSSPIMPGSIESATVGGDDSSVPVVAAPLDTITQAGPNVDVVRRTSF
eukprot:CAMPEP_0184699716 /NCGR_PEP_ID=MMETSP0313-20130426/5882_1 /TAXON_ID=2792 /ORGANISM="Porphyridium aerugineum, Strain SAG 1380-2" /LENGTH=1733 /DNA_ID=CAMNT_0027158839 /DNA_START=49 /DNA_END=5250 /DNA_ORIENTATION=-